MSGTPHSDLVFFWFLVFFLSGFFLMLANMAVSIIWKTAKHWVQVRYLIFLILSMCGIASIGTVSEIAKGYEWVGMTSIVVSALLMLVLGAIADTIETRENTEKMRKQ